MKENFLNQDRQRYVDGKIPLFQVAWRKAQASSFYPTKLF